MTEFDTWDLAEKVSPAKQSEGHKYNMYTKTLMDLCLECVGNNLDSLPRAGTFLAATQKEMLIERLACHDRLQPSYLPHVTYNLFAPILKRLNFYHASQVTDAVLKLLSSSKCQLHYLTLHACDNVTDAGVQHITNNQKELRELELIKLTKLTAKGLREVCSPVLTKVSLRGSSLVPTEGVKCLVSKNPTIEVLNLVLCAKLDESVVPVVATNLKSSLKDLDLAYLNVVNDAGLIALGEHCPNLVRLNLHGCNRISECGLSVLFEGCALKKLDLSYCGKIQSLPENPCMRSMPTSMSELSLCGVNIGNKDLFVDCVKRLIKLKNVRLCGVPALTDDTLEEILSVIGSQLEHLDLSGSIMCDLTDHGLRSITNHCTNLETLGLSLIREITCVTLLPLLKDAKRAENLTTLLLSCKKLVPEVLQAISTKCHGLEKLDLSGLASVDDSLVIRLAEQCPRLTYINLKGCRQVTDLSICELARSCPLTTAVLSGLTDLTDSSIFALANSCPYLDGLYLSGCYKVTAAAIKYLLDTCIPRVYYQHKVPNANPGQLMARNLDTGQFVSS